MVAMLNIDGLNLIADTRDIAALGSEWSSLGASFRAAAAAERYVLTPPDSPIMQEAIRQDFFNRSDQAPFARAGVPALFLYFGDQVGGAAPGSGKQKLDEYLEQRYHRPNDDLTQPFDYNAGARSLRVFARTLVSVANAPEAARWKPGAPYGR
jgi:Zn-dependent M28 family amino/carboxypeptidase